MNVLKNLLLKAVLCAGILIGGTHSAKAQLDLAGEILRAGTDDANLLFKEYIRPFAEGFGADLNTGWISRSRPNNVLQLDIMLRTGVAFVPSSSRTFSIEEIPFLYLDHISGPREVQTAFGAETEGPELGMFGYNLFNGERQELGRFTMPGGTGYPYVPAPIIQAGLGVGVDTEFIVRFVPPVRLGTMKVGTNGFGIKHRINHWFARGSSLPVDVTLHAGFSQLSSTVHLNVQPEVREDIYDPFTDDPGAWSGQAVKLEAVGFSGNLILGRSLQNLSLFGSVGIQTSRMSIHTPGGYPVITFNHDYDPDVSGAEFRRKRIERALNPVNLDYKEPNILFGSAGLSYDLQMLTFSASLSYSNYIVLNFGVGVNL